MSLIHLDSDIKVRTGSSGGF